MEIATRHTPAYGVARLTLSGGEPVRVESGAMMAMSAGVTLESKAEGGVMKSLKRAALGGESFFISTYTAPAQGGFVDVAARLPGDIAHYTVDPVARRCSSRRARGWRTSRPSPSTRSGVASRTCSARRVGSSCVPRAPDRSCSRCYGALEVWNLQAGQHITVDTGHMVAYEDSVQMAIRQAGGGVVKMFKSGEGLVFDFSGPGRVWTQTRNPNELLGWIGAALGQGSSSSPSIGGLFGRG